MNMDSVQKDALGVCLEIIKLPHNDSVNVCLETPDSKRLKDYIGVTYSEVQTPLFLERLGLVKIDSGGSLLRSVLVGIASGTQTDNVPEKPINGPKGFYTIKPNIKKMREWVEQINSVADLNEDEPLAKKLSIHTDGQIEYRSGRSNLKVAFGLGSNGYLLLSYLGHNLGSLYSADDIDTNANLRKSGSDEDGRVRNTIKTVRKAFRVGGGGFGDPFIVQGKRFGLAADVTVEFLPPAQDFPKVVTP